MDGGSLVYRPSSVVTDGTRLRSAVYLQLAQHLPVDRDALGTQWPFVAQRPLDALSRQLDGVGRAQKQPQPGRETIAIDHAGIAQAAALKIEVTLRRRLLAAFALVVDDGGAGEIDDPPAVTQRVPGRQWAVR